MKTIGKKVKAIYTLAVIALVSICMSFIPLMTNTVKADVETSTTGLRITGAQVKVIDEAYKQYADPQDEFALYFHAEITEEFYNTLKTGEQNVQFGMLIGPSAMINSFGGYTAEAVEEFEGEVGAVVTEGNLTDVNKAANFRFVGTGLQEEVEFTNGIKTFEAGVVFNTTELANQSGLAEDVVAKLAASTDLTAIPYYVVDGLVTMNALDVATRNAKDVLVETAVRINNECSDSDIDKATVDALIAKYVGAVEYVEDEAYFDLNTGKVFVAQADNTLVPYVKADNVEYVAVAGVKEGGKIDSSSFKYDKYVGLVKTYEDGKVEAVSAKIATRVFSTVNDFFFDTDGDGVGNIADANYVFHLDNSGRTPISRIDGYFVLANNVDINNKELNSVPGEQGLYIGGDWNMGNHMTFDGRGFAMSNIKTFCRDGLFGLLNGATIKNIAFDGIHCTRNDGTNIFAYTSYGVTLENVYVRISANNGGGNYTSSGSFGSMSDERIAGKSLIKNLVFENSVALIEGNYGRPNRAAFGGDASPTIENSTVVGLTRTWSQVAHATDTTKQVVSLTMPTSAMTALGVEAKEYALTELPTAVASAYAGLVANVNRCYSVTVGYIKFVADTVGIAYHLDNDSLAKSDLASIYEETGCWQVIGDQLLWKSLIDENNFIVKTSVEGNSFKDNISLDMYYGATKLDAQITLSGAGVAYVDFSGNTISRKVNAQVLADQAITATISYKEYTKTVDLTLLFDIDKVITYESGEFVVDKYTGKVLKANANNELVAYNATGYLAGSDTLSINGVAQTIANTAEFAVDKANLATLADGEKYVLLAGDNALVAQVVTKVFFSIRDFFKDANGDGVVADDEMTNANNFFFLNITSSKATIKIDGYYVLANNIDFAYNSALSAHNNEQSPNNTNEDFGFQGTFDGRGFAISNLRPYNVAGLFGLVKNATIKDVAFINMSSDRNNGSRTYFARYVYDSVLENVYIKITDNHWVTWNQGDTVTAPAISGISNSTFTNVVFENNAWKSTSTNNRENSWTYFTAATGSATYTNTNVIGAPSVVSYAVQVKAADADDGVTKHKVQLTLPLAEIQKYVAGPGVYALAECSAYANGGAFKNLIDGIQKGENAKGANIQFIEFIAETRNIGYAYDNASLSADAVNAYLATGNWVKAGTDFVWASTLDNSKISAVVSNGEIKEGESTDISVSYNDKLISGVELSVSDADAKYVAISGNTITVKEGINLIADKVITVTASYANCETTVDLTILFDIDKVVPYVEGEFVIDKTSGKVYKAEDTTNKLVAYDATSYLAGATDVEVGGVQQTLTGTEVFAFDKAGLATLADGEMFVIAAGENYLVARLVTKVLSTKADFFNDLDGNGVIENLDTNGDGAINGTAVDGVYDHRELVITNCILHIPYGGSGNHYCLNANTGYYVLANNINLNYDGTVGFASGDIRPYIPSDFYYTSGFMGTFDGRGFAIDKIHAGSSPAGLFGLLNGATIKNIAFKNVYSTKNDSGINFLAFKVYRTTFENVYISTSYPGNWGDTYISETATKVFGDIQDLLGVSTFTNVIVENTGALNNAWPNKMARFIFGNYTTPLYTNVNVVGMPTYYTYGDHASDAANKVLTIYLPASNIAEYGLTAQEYAIADCEALATDFAGLITNLQNRYGTVIGYIKVVEDTTARGHYISNTALSADTDVVNAYVATGCWTVKNGVLAWAK